MPENLERILHDLSKHHREKGTMMVDAINERLAKAVETYYKQLTNSLEYLAKQNNSVRILKNI